jgi:hypothetical protein
VTRLLALVLGVALLAGCGAEFVADPPREAAPASPADPEIDVAIADPTAITIPKLDAHSTLIPLGLGPDGELAAPPVTEPMQAGWYAGADPATSGDEFQPGEIGPAIVAGHVDGIVNGRKGQPGIFARLHELAPGDEILIDRDGQSQLRFIVTAVQRYAKAAFPTDAVYGPTEHPELRLITCGGEFDRSTGHYVDNTIAWATLG